MRRRNDFFDPDEYSGYRPGYGGFRAFPGVLGIELRGALQFFLRFAPRAEYLFRPAYAGYAADDCHIASKAGESAVLDGFYPFMRLVGYRAHRRIGGLQYVGFRDHPFPAVREGERYLRGKVEPLWRLGAVFEFKGFRRVRGYA
jgi:hypothetical protein